MNCQNCGWSISVPLELEQFRAELEASNTQLRISQESCAVAYKEVEKLRSQLEICHARHAALVATLEAVRDEEDGAGDMKELARQSLKLTEEETGAEWAAMRDVVEAARPLRNHGLALYVAFARLDAIREDGM